MYIIDISASSRAGVRTMTARLSGAWGTRVGEKREVRLKRTQSRPTDTWTIYTHTHTQ